MKCATILYIHGMGGGGDSRIPSILSDFFKSSQKFSDKVRVVVRTYDFDPEIAYQQIRNWIDELKPSLIVGESLGSIQAMRIKGLPHILVSPSLGAPSIFSKLAFLTLIPGVSYLLDKIYLPKPGDRQALHFSYRTMRKYEKHLLAALQNSPAKGGTDSFFAFFGTKDHYMKTGIVSIAKYEKYFGKTYGLYPGTHFMEEEYLYEMLIPKIIETLGI